MTNENGKEKNGSSQVEVKNCHLAGSSSLFHRPLSKILLLSWKIPPAFSGSSIVVQNLASQFTRDEMIVVGEKPIETFEQTWDNAWPDLYYVIKSWPLTRRGRDKWRIVQFPLLVAKTFGLVLKKRCDVIVAIFPSTDFLFAGYLVAKWTGARFFAYFHNTLVENRSGYARNFAKWLQFQVFSQAECVFVLSDGLANFYRDHYPETDFSVLPHLINETIPTFSFPPVHEPIRLVILGTIGDACLDATKRVCEAVSRLENCRLEFISGTQRKYFEKNGLLNDRITHITVSHAMLRNHLSEADIMVLPHGFTGAYSDIEYKTIFPTRTIDYLISGRPILAHSPSNSFITHFLIQNNCALVVDKPNASELVASIELLRKEGSLRSRLVQNALRAAEPFQASRVIADFKTHIWIGQYAS